MTNGINFKNKFEIVRDLIREDILNGKYSPGERLPTEEELTEAYGINKVTVSKAITSLSSEGFVVRKPRIGSTVLDLRERKVTTRLGVVMTRTTGHVYGILHTLLLKNILKTHYFPLVIDINAFDSIEERETYLSEHFQDLINANPEFFIIDGMEDIPFKLLKKFSSQIKNLIFINRLESDIKFNAVFALSDYEKSGYLGTSHLLDSGCKRIIFVTQGSVKAPENNLNRQILKGVKQVFKERNLKFDKNRIFHLTDLKEPVENIFIKEFSKKQKPDGIFTFRDSIARQIQWGLESNNIKMGEDYQAVSIYNTPWATNFKPPLSSISIGEEAIAEKIGKILSARDFRKKKYLIEPELFIRDSSGR